MNNDLEIFPRADVYIAAMGRSGSTMLANLMTVPPWRLMLVEPWLTDGGTGRSLLMQARGFGWAVTDDEYHEQPGESLEARWHRIFGHRVAALDAWGCKEVQPNLHAPTIALLRPRTLVLQVRNLVDVTLSLLEMAARQGGQDPFGHDDWARHYVSASAATLADLAGTSAAPTVIVRYEDFVSSAAYRSEFQRLLAWGLGGDLSRNMDAFNRTYEKERRGGRIRADGASLAQRMLPEESLALATEISEANPVYRATFGY